MSGRRDLSDSPLPHRAPFRLVDRLASVGDGEAMAIRQVTANDPLTGGELSGSLVVEALAQTAALMNTGELGGHRGFLVALRNVRFESAVHAGDTLSLHARRTATMGALHKVTAEAHVGDRLVASGELTFAVELA